MLTYCSSRSLTLRTCTSRIKKLFPLAISASTHVTTGNIHIALATKLGRQVLRRSASMCMVSSTCLRARRRVIRSRKRVRATVSINLGHHLQRAFYLIQLLTLVYYITVKELTELLQQVKDEQSYIIVRERTHRNTAESTNARVKWWSIFQLGVLIGEGIFQVWWLKRFFEVCRSSMQRFDCALTMFGIGKKGCLSAHGHMALALYVRIWIDYLGNTSQRDNRISEEIFSFDLETDLAGSTLVPTIPNSPTRSYTDYFPESYLPSIVMLPKPFTTAFPCLACLSYASQHSKLSQFPEAGPPLSNLRANF